MTQQDEQKPIESENDQEKIVELKESEYLKLLQELKDHKDKYVRIHAEFDNARKRTEREKMEFVKYANEELMSEFLAILDDLERSVQAASNKHQDYDAFLKGIEMVMAHVHELLKKQNVTPIDAVGKKFDPHCHEVLMQQESDEHEDGMVIEQFQKGYALNGRLIRTAKVKVAVNHREEKL